MKAIDKTIDAAWSLWSLAEDGYNAWCDAGVWLEHRAPAVIQFPVVILIVVVFFVVLAPVGLVARLAGRAVAR